MFCTNCGNQLPKGSRFCIYCGTPVAQEPAPVSPEADAPVEEAVFAPEYAAPAEEPVYEAPAYQYDPPVSQEPARYEQDFPTYSDAPMTPAPRKKKKTGLIVALVVIVVLLLAAGGMGLYLYNQYQENLAAYGEADALLDSRDYDGALDAFLALGDFEDAADRAAQLTQLQEDYDDAAALLAENKFDEAAEAFNALKDYRDSETYVSSEIGYQKAVYIVTCAKDGSTDALDLVLEEGTAYEEGTEARLQLNYAAEAFAALGDYKDSATLASECWLNIALLELEQGNYDAALSCAEKLTQADAEKLNEAYTESCADAQFLIDIVDAFVAWYDEYDDCTFAEELENAAAIVAPYTEQPFADAALEQILWDFAECLDTMYSAVDSDGDVADWVTYYQGMAQLYALADELYLGYGVFADSSYLTDCFVGYTDVVAPYPYIEADLMNWWNTNPDASPMDDGHYYAVYTNNSGYNYTLFVTVYFFGPDGTLLEVGEEFSIHVNNGETIHIPLIPTTISDEEWSTWNMGWWYYTD